MAEAEQKRVSGPWRINSSEWFEHTDRPGWSCNAGWIRDYLNALEDQLRTAREALQRIQYMTNFGRNSEVFDLTVAALESTEEEAKEA